MQTAGSISQLMSTGLQDHFLTHKPSMCLFKSTWKQYGNFSMTLQEQTNNGTVNFGQKVQCQLQKMGDMIGKVYVQVTLDELKYKGDKQVKAAWVKGVGLAMLENVSLNIGNQIIDQYNSEWAFAWYELTHKKDFKEGYKKMIGYTPEFNELEQPNQNGVIKPQLTMYIPLNFWFTRSYKMALPLISLQFHHCIFQFSIANKDKLINWTGTDNIEDFHMGIRDFTVKAEYIYLEDRDRQRIETYAHEYLIEIVQYNNPEQLSGSQNSVQHKYQLKMGHPCKELDFYIKVGAFSNDGCSFSSQRRNRFLCYSHDDNDWSKAIDQGAHNIGNSMIKVLLSKDVQAQQSQQYNNFSNINNFSQQQQFNFKLGQSINLQQPQQKTQTTGTNMISDYNGELWQVQGKEFRRVNHQGKEYVSFNYSDLVPPNVNTKHLTNHTIRIDVNFYDQYGYKFKNDDVLEYANQQVLVLLDELPMRKDGFNYATLIDSIQVDVQLLVESHQLASPQEKLRTIAEANKQKVIVKEHTLDIDIVSIPTNQCEDFRSQQDRLQDVFMTQHDNYGLRIDGTGNALQQVKLQFSQSDRLNDNTNLYYNYVQPYQHHDTIPKEGLNMYSFALDPNSTQPSGSANFSRIDGIQLLLTYQDKMRQHKQRGPKLDFIADTKIHCFTRSLNIFKVSRGVGGLFFI